MFQQRFAQLAAVASAALLACSAVNAATVPATVTATGSYSGSLGLLTDGYIPVQGTYWDDPATVNWTYGEGASGTVFTFAFSQLYTLQDITLSVDNNDYYRVQSSVDGVTWNTLLRVVAGDGSVGYGLDTFSSVAGSTYYNEDIDFAPTLAKFVRVYATGGDRAYSLGEVRIEGVAVVPEPEGVALALAGLGVVGLVGFRRRDHA